ncbi:hypothetical protein [Paenibacillus flagellatus]|uniref:hypothetical protein n=1 Tax=Paenibacillus flagellatus TaxID=2211139 RepID=UPI0011B48977|nr:hypothetical protein [Paenibacillus flagellatus]
MNNFQFGALEYAMLSPRLRELNRKSFEAANWVTGTSSPWLERYRIEGGTKREDGSVAFQVRFDYRSSTDIDKEVPWTDIEPFPVVVSEDEDGWRVSSFLHNWKHQSVRLPDGVVLTDFDGVYEGSDVRLQLQRLGVANGPDPIREAVGNHAEIVERREMDLPVGKATFAEVKRTPPAAAQSDAVMREYWLVVLDDEPERADRKRAYAWTGIVTGDAEAAREELLDTARTWKLEQE